MWFLWLTIWHCYRLLSDQWDFSLSLLFHQSSILIFHSSITDAKQTQLLRASLNNIPACRRDSCRDIPLSAIVLQAQLQYSLQLTQTSRTATSVYLNNGIFAVCAHPLLRLPCHFTDLTHISLIGRVYTINRWFQARRPAH